VLTATTSRSGLRGTAVAAATLPSQCPGKTEHHNAFTDAGSWGFFADHDLVGVWIGFDESQTLGVQETRSAARLPIGMNFYDHRNAGKDPGSRSDCPPEVP